MKNLTFSHHYTEYNSQVRRFLEKRFKGLPKIAEAPFDLRIGDTTVEVKSCRPWIKAAGSNGPKRRGRFKIGDHEKSEYVLFVLTTRPTFKFSLQKLSDVKRNYGSSINWREIFGVQ